MWNAGGVVCFGEDGLDCSLCWSLMVVCLSFEDDEDLRWSWWEYLYPRNPTLEYARCCQYAYPSRLPPCITIQSYLLIHCRGIDSKFREASLRFQTHYTRLGHFQGKWQWKWQQFAGA